MERIIIFMIKWLAVTSSTLAIIWHFVFLVVISFYAIGVDLPQQVLAFLSVAGFLVKTTQRSLGRCCPMPTTPNSGKRHFTARAKNQNSEWTSLTVPKLFLWAGQQHIPTPPTELPPSCLSHCRYSYAIVGINLTEMAYSLLKSGALKPHFYNTVQGAPELKHFHQLYCEFSLSLYCF